MVNSFGEPWGKWHELKEQFQAAEKNKAVSSEASKYARVAVESMVMAEKKWGRMKRKRVGFKQGQLAGGRVKRSHDVVFYVIKNFQISQHCQGVEWVRGIGSNSPPRPFCLSMRSKLLKVESHAEPVCDCAIS